MPKEFSDILMPFIAKEIPEAIDEINKNLGYEVLKLHFSFEKNNYQIFFDKFKDDSEKLDKYVRAIKFYYFWCKEPHKNTALKPDFKLIVIFSIIESLMAHENFIDLGTWLQKEMKKHPFKISEKEDLSILLNKYYNTHGSIRKVKKFFNTYCTEDLESLLQSMKKWDKKVKKFVALKDIEDLVMFIEGIRNLFIHTATHIQISSFEKFLKKSRGFTHYRSETLTSIKNASYVIDNEKMHIEGVLEIFEKGLINYFSEV